MTALRLRRKGRECVVAHVAGHVAIVVVMLPSKRSAHAAGLQIAKQPDAPVPARHALLQQRERGGGVAVTGALVEFDGFGARHETRPRG
ncbi:MAG: hypothetical protein JO239_03730 [Paraburkholderia sp.]|nr:hypothetical protein [Paraburkholderia sp.]